jgi:hypothetical protein
MNVNLDQWRVTNTFEAVDLAGLNDKDIAGAAFEGLAVHRPYAAAFPHELDLVIRMPMRARPRTRLPMEQKHRDSSIALLSPDELM